MNLIAITDSNWGIGKEGNLLFNLPPDMERFKSLTNNKVVVMGRKTYQTLRVAPLPNRINIVLTRQELTFAKGVIVAHDMSHLLQILKQFSTEDVMIIGGGKVYSGCLHLCEKAYITQVNSIAEADTYLTDLNKYGWTIDEATDIMKYKDYSYRYLTYCNINKQF